MRTHSTHLSADMEDRLMLALTMRRWIHDIVYIHVSLVPGSPLHARAIIATDDLWVQRSSFAIITRMRRGELGDKAIYMCELS